jgi:type I restriction enzyme S subunit
LSDELPQGWVTARISELCDVPKEKGREGVVPYLEIGNVDIASKSYAFTGKPSVKGCRIARKNDVLVSKVRPTRGAITWIREEELQVSSAFTVLRNRGALAEKCLWQFLAWNRCYLNHLGENCTGTMYPTTSDEAVVNFKMPLPPFAEQRRIVAKLETLLGKVGACQQRLRKIPVLLKRFRQSILAAACSGRLTADWREENGLTLEDDWRDAQFSEFVESSFYGPRFSKESYSTKGVPTIRTTDMGFDGSIELKDSPCISLSKKELEKFGLQDGDLVVTRTGATIGKCALYDKSLGPAIPGAYLIRFRFKRDAIVPKFALRFLMSPKGQRLLVAGSTAVAQPNVNATTISQFVVHLPPLAEQQEIVHRVEALFTLADQIEARFTQARAQVDKLTPSLPARGFRGDLVPQDPNDEPASALLERIKRAPSKAGRRGKKKVQPFIKDQPVLSTP